MNELLPFLKVAESNLKKIERQLKNGNVSVAVESLQILVETLKKTELQLDFCPQLSDLKNKSIDLLANYKEGVNTQ